MAQPAATAAPHWSSPSGSVLALVWRAGEILLATPAGRVVEVLPPLPWRSVAGVPAWVRGIVVHRGRPTALVDPRLLLGVAPEEDRMGNRVIVLELTGSATAGAEESGSGCGFGGATLPVGLWASAVLDLAHVDFASAAAHPGFETATARALGPIGQTPWGLAQLVRAERLFTDEQRAVLLRRLEEGVA